MPIEHQVAIIFAATQGFLDDVPVEKIKKFEEKFHEYLKLEQKELLNEIREKKELTEEIDKKLKEVIEKFKKSFDFKI